jgi:hypothetical protein
MSTAVAWLSSVRGHLGESRFSPVGNGIESDPSLVLADLCTTLSGSAVTLKFSRMRDGVTDPVRTAVPR